MPAAARARCAMHAASLMAPVLRCVGARALLDPTLALLAADRGSSQRRLGARLRRRARPRGGALARRRLAMPAAARARCAMHAASSMAPVLRCVGARALLDPILALLAADRGSSQRRLGARLRRRARPRSGALARRRLAMPAAARARCAMHAASLMAPVLRFVGARALLDPTLALLAADRGSSQRRLGARLRRCARPRGGALARRRLAMPAAARARCAMHAASLMAPVPRSSVLVLSSTRPSLCSPLTAARASAASALGCVAALVRAAALSLAAGSPCRRRLALAARCTRRRHGARAALRRCSCSPRPDPRSARR